jgi:hypothetical protein
MTTSSRGAEREAFVRDFLGNVLPPLFRFGTGDATDASGRRSGQLDIVVEYPFSPSLPGAFGGSTNRLYLADGIAAVIEVKSNVSRQWNEALQTAAQLAPLQRSISIGMTMGDPPSDNIPLFIAGYTGWKTIGPLQRRLSENPQISGILIIDKGLFVSKLDELICTGAWALWGLICTLHRITNALSIASINPLRYATLNRPSAPTS